MKIFKIFSKKTIDIPTKIAPKYTYIRHQIAATDNTFQGAYIPILEQYERWLMVCGLSLAETNEAFRKIGTMLKARKGFNLPQNINNEKLSHYREVVNYVLTLAVITNVIAELSAKYAIDDNDIIKPIWLSEDGLSKNAFVIERLTPRNISLYGNAVVHMLIIKAPLAIKWFESFPDMYEVLTGLAQGEDKELFTEVMNRGMYYYCKSEQVSNQNAKVEINEQDDNSMRKTSFEKEWEEIEGSDEAPVDEEIENILTDLLENNEEAVTPLIIEKDNFVDEKESIEVEHSDLSIEELLGEVTLGINKEKADILIEVISKLEPFVANYTFMDDSGACIFVSTIKFKSLMKKYTDEPLDKYMEGVNSLMMMRPGNAENRKFAWKTSINAKDLTLFIPEELEKFGFNMPKDIDRLDELVTLK